MEGLKVEEEMSEMYNVTVLLFTYMRAYIQLRSL